MIQAGRSVVVWTGLTFFHFMTNLVIFLLLSLPLAFISRKCLLIPSSHGFYRFFGWECILWLLISNVPHWYNDPLSWKQVLSWIVLIASIWYAVSGFILLHRKGKASQRESRDGLYGFEKTTELVETGLFRFIRHPLYGSLILLAWGTFLKNTTVTLFLVSLAATLFLYVAARIEEKECIGYFGDTYASYMQRTTMFIPFLF